MINKSEDGDSSVKNFQLYSRKSCFLQELTVHPPTWNGAAVEVKNLLNFESSTFKRFPQRLSRVALSVSKYVIKTAVQCGLGRHEDDRATARAERAAHIFQGDSLVTYVFQHVDH